MYSEVKQQHKGHSKISHICYNSFETEEYLITMKHSYYSHFDQETQNCSKQTFQILQIKLVQ